MNSSGKIIPSLTKQGIKPENILVIHDELEKPFGSIAIKTGGSHRGHNGLRSIIESCGAEFHRLRFGIGRPENKENVPNYVLSNFSKNEIIEPLIDQAIEIIEKMVTLLNNQNTLLNNTIETVLPHVNPKVKPSLRHILAIYNKGNGEYYITCTQRRSELRTFKRLKSKYANASKYFILPYNPNSIDLFIRMKESLADKIIVNSRNVKLKNDYTIEELKNDIISLTKPSPS